MPLLFWGFEIPFYTDGNLLCSKWFPSRHPAGRDRQVRSNYGYSGWFTWSEFPLSALPGPPTRPPLRVALPKVPIPETPLIFPNLADPVCLMICRECCRLAVPAFCDYFRYGPFIARLMNQIYISPIGKCKFFLDLV